ncbi:MAG: 1-aminocyclopropane-1-carboxylate deaminase/D-cysteine desulfhydrase, partial [Bacteroidota bacterium]
RSLLSYQEPAVQEFFHPAFADAGISVRVLREDQNNPAVSGNKWWKLRPYLERALRSGQSLVTFGGPWSNHIYATAAACLEAGIPCTGIIRGERPTVLSTTLQFAEACGMQLEFVSREFYRRKNDAEIRDALVNRFGNCLIVPEGGSGPEAVEHCAEWGRKIAAQHAFDVLCCPVGTGGTVAGLLRGISESIRIIGFCALKDGGFLRDAILQQAAVPDRKNWELLTDFHFGGYGKAPSHLLDFIRDINDQFSLPLDAVYTGKMVMGLITLASTGLFPRGARVLVVHTGGLQGNEGFK